MPEGLAVPPAVELSVIQAAGAFATVVSILNGVPAVAADVIVIVCAASGMYVLPLREQVSASVPLGATVRPDVVAAKVAETVTGKSVCVAPVDEVADLKLNVAAAIFVNPTQPAAGLVKVKVYVIPAA